MSPRFRIVLLYLISAVFILLGTAEEIERRMQHSTQIEVFPGIPGFTSTSDALPWVLIAIGVGLGLRVRAAATFARTGCAFAIIGVGLGAILTLASSPRDSSLPVAIAAAFLLIFLFLDSPGTRSLFHRSTPSTPQVTPPLHVRYKNGGALACLFAFIFVIVTGVFYLRTRSLLSTGVRDLGTIIRVTESGGFDISFRDAENMEHSFTTRTGNANRHNGDRVPIIYSRGNPSDAEALDEVWTTTIFWSIATGIALSGGLLFLLCGVAARHFEAKASTEHPG